MTTDFFNRDIFYTRMCGEEQALADAIGKFIKHAAPQLKIAPHWHWFQQPHHGDRARQVDAAMEAAAGRALLALGGRLEGVSLLAVWPMLRELCHDLALCLGGAALSEALVAAGFGALDAHEGEPHVLPCLAGASPPQLAAGCDCAHAVNGAHCSDGSDGSDAIHVAVNHDTGIILRRFIGIDDIADAMRVNMPAAVVAYQRGVAEAWGRVPDLRGADSADAPFFGADFQLGRPGDAARHLAFGHETVVMALLAALAAALRRDPAGMASLCAALRHSPRLGPTLATWVARHASLLAKHAQLQAPNAHEWA